MTIPDAAFEAAALVMAGRHPGDADMWTPLARAAVEAAMPAIREAIAQEIEGYDISDKSVTLEWDKGMQTAARIVRGGTP